jgi:predicted nucleic acid-binding protein
MNVYVETNFVLELVFEQEQYQWCEKLLSLCEAKKLSLLLPAYCLAEPHEKLARQHNTRLDLQRVLNAEIRQLSRTASYVSRISQIRDVRDLLIQSNQDEQQRFYHYRNRILGIIEIMPLTAEIIRDGERNEGLYQLRPQDALVYASVFNHLRQFNTNESCFLNRNSRDFDIPNILQELTQYNCRMIPLFDQGYHFIHKRVASD